MMSLVMNRFLVIVIVVALAVAFLYTLLWKFGVWEYLQVHADGWAEKVTHKSSDFFNQLFSCTFCTTWWMSVIGCLVMAIVFGDWIVLLVPFCSTPISKYLI